MTLANTDSIDSRCTATVQVPRTWSCYIRTVGCGNDPSNYSYLKVTRNLSLSSIVRMGVCSLFSLEITWGLSQVAKTNVPRHYISGTTLCVVRLVTVLCYVPGDIEDDVNLLVRDGSMVQQL